MSKYILIALFWFICVISKAQLKDYFGVWLTPTNEYIFIDSIKLYDNYTGSLSGLYLDMFRVSLSNDTLNFKQILADGTCFSSYDFKVIKINDSLLVVDPISDFLKKHYNNKKNLKFIKQGYLIDKNINFEKLFFKITYEYDYPYATYLLEIDNNRNVKLSAKNIFKEGSTIELDSAKNGKFIGTLTDSIYNELLYHLRTCNLKANTFDGIVSKANLTDKFYNYAIIYFNSQRKQIDIELNIVTSNLQYFLSKIISETKFKKQ